MLGATGPDAELATQLEEMSQIAKSTRGYSAEAALLMRSADLTDSLELKARRILRASAGAMNAGLHNQATALLDQARPHLSSPLAIAEAEELRGQLTIRNFQPAEAPGQLLAADAPSTCH